MWTYISNIKAPMLELLTSGLAGLQLQARCDRRFGLVEELGVAVVSAPSRSISGSGQLVAGPTFVKKIDSDETPSRP